MTDCLNSSLASHHTVEQQTVNTWNTFWLPGLVWVPQHTTPARSTHDSRYNQGKWREGVGVGQKSWVRNNFYHHLTPFWKGDEKKLLSCRGSFFNNKNIYTFFTNSLTAFSSPFGVNDDTTLLKLFCAQNRWVCT